MAGSGIAVARYLGKTYGCGQVAPGGYIDSAKGYLFESPEGSSGLLFSLVHAGYAGMPHACARTDGGPMEG